MNRKDTAFIYGLTKKALQDRRLQRKALELIEEVIETSYLERPKPSGDHQ